MKGHKKPSKSLRWSGIFCISLGLSACGGGGNGTDDQTLTAQTYSITTTLGDGGDINPRSTEVNADRNTVFNITLDEGYVIDSVEGCNGNLVGTTYTTNVISSNCEVAISFKQVFFRVTTTAGPGGKFELESFLGRGTQSLRLLPDSGYVVDQVVGCSGRLDENTYNIDELTRNCEVSATFKRGTTLSVMGEPTKSLNFEWVDTPGASHYKLYENTDGKAGFVQVGQDIVQGTQRYKHIVPLFARVNASYFLEICFDQVCKSSNTVDVKSQLANGIGEIYPEGFQPGGRNCGMQISADHSTLVISACHQDSATAEINEDSADDSLESAGAVYVFSLEGSEWQQEAYITPSDPGSYDYFGYSISLSADGSRLVVGAPGEDSLSTGIDGDASDDSGGSVGAAYIFERGDSGWSQTTYIKASVAPPQNKRSSFGNAVATNDAGNRIAIGSLWSDGRESGTGSVYIFDLVEGTWVESATIWAESGDSGDKFGTNLKLDSSGSILLVGASWEDGASVGIDGDESNNSKRGSGAAYIFKYDGSSWLQQAYLKANRAVEDEFFGEYLTISGSGQYIAIGSKRESSRQQWSGAVYIYQFDGVNASQIGFLKASNADESDRFGSSVSLNYDGSTLLVSAPGEDSYSSAFSGDQANNHYQTDRRNPGALYLFSRVGDSFTQSSYIKSKNSDEFDIHAAIISRNSETLFVSAYEESRDNRGQPVILVY